MAPDTQGGSGPEVPLFMTALAEGPFTSADGAPLSVTLELPAERLERGPAGTRFRVRLPEGRGAPGLDWVRESDERRGPYVDLPCPGDTEALLADRRFLAQHAYAVAAATLKTFESTLGRRLPWRHGSHQLPLYVFDRVDFSLTGYEPGAVRFGHCPMRGSGRRHVPLALFHDIVAHEVTHAILDGYRPHFAERSRATRDELAIHEAVADLVALLSVFGSTARVEARLHGLTIPLGHPEDAMASLRESGLFGIADGIFERRELRRSVACDIPVDWRDEGEPHRRAEVFVQAMMKTVLDIWAARMRRPGGAAGTYQIAEAGATAGRHALRLLIRGLGYTPPVNATFEDLLTGILVADRTMVPDDDLGYRSALVSAFAALGIEPALDGTFDNPDVLGRLKYPVHLSALASDPEEVHRFLWENPVLLRQAAIDPDSPYRVERVRPNVRVGPDGFVVSEIGASFVQELRLTAREARRRLGLRTSGPVVIRGGGLLRFDEFGRLSFAVLKPVMDPDGQQRRTDECTWRQGEPDAAEDQTTDVHQSIFATMHGPAPETPPR